ncbi:MAG: CvpA family protein, partial [Lachnospiraceae bacterium]
EKMNWVLIAVLAIVALFTLSGIHRGLIKMIYSIVSLVGTLIVVFLLLPVATGVIKDNTKIYQNLEQIVSEKMIPETEYTGVDQDKIIDSMGLPEVIKDIVRENNTAEKYIELGVSTLREYVIKTVADIIFNVAAFIIAFIVVFIIFRILFGFINALASLPIINGVNKLAGGAAGFVMGMTMVWIVFGLLSVFGNSELSQNVFEKVNDSALLTFICNNNFVMKYLEIIMR